jgi:DNA repair exonuclease SbcCD ATPase subunit
LLQSILNELRQLRFELQRINVNAHRAQILLERLRIKQEQVTQLVRDLETVRSQVVELRTQRTSLSEKLDEARTKVDRGVLAPEVAKELQTALDAANGQERDLVDREARLSIELNAHRRELDELNQRLDESESQLWNPAATSPARKNTRRR